jgi:hypothetical protein
MEVLEVKIQTIEPSKTNAPGETVFLNGARKQTG